MRRALLSAIAISAMAACAPVAPAPRSKTAAPKAPSKPAEAAAATPTEQTGFVYSYIPSGKRDPFRSPLDELAAERGGLALVNNSACSAPLCRWDLDQLKLVGVISGMSNPMAMVEDPSGVGYVIRRNSFMGKKGGRVTQIKHDSVVVTEVIKGTDGKPHPNEIPLHMAAEAHGSGDTDLLQSEGSE